MSLPFGIPDLKTVIENAANPENAALAPWFSLAERAVIALERQAEATETLANSAQDQASALRVSVNGGYTG
jgi:hypothetical protein